VNCEQRTGLVQAYISTVENGHTIPTVGTLEKFASALDVPLYAFFIDERVKNPKLPEAHDNGSNGNDRREFQLLANAFVRMSERDQMLLIATAQKMVQRKIKR
jgi:transcriptional regulator with XRE-family HTH domain